jgi:hypothetical protein
MEYDLMWDPSGMSASCFPRSIMFRYLVIVRDTHTPSVALMVILTIIAAIAFLGALLSILLYLRRRWLRLDSAGATTLGGPKGAFLGPTMNVRGIEAHEFATHTKTVFLPVHEGESAEYGAANAFGMHGIAMGDGARSLAVAQDPSLARRAIADIPLPVPGDGIDGYDGAKGRRHFVDVYGEANPNGDTSTGSLRRRRGEPESRADARRRAMLIARGEDPDAWMVGPDGVLVRRTGSASRRGAGGAASASAGGPGVRRTGAANRGFGSGAPPGSRAAQRLQSASVFPSHAGLRAGGDYALHEVEVGARSRSGSARGDRNGAGGPGDADAMGSPLGPDGRPRVAVRFVPQWVLGSFGRGGAIPDIGDGEDPERVGTRPHNDIIMLPEPYATTAGSAGSPMSAGSREAIEREDGVAPAGSSTLRRPLRARRSCSSAGREVSVLPPASRTTREMVAAHPGGAAFGLRPTASLSTMTKLLACLLKAARRVARLHAARPVPAVVPPLAVKAAPRVEAPAVRQERPAAVALWLA